MNVEMQDSQETGQKINSLNKSFKEYDPNDPQNIERRKNMYKENIVKPYPNPVSPNGPLYMKFSYDQYKHYLDPAGEEKKDKENYGSSATFDFQVVESPDGTMQVVTEWWENPQTVLYMNSLQIFDMSGKVVAKNEAQQPLSNSEFDESSAKIDFNAPLAKWFYVVSAQLSDGTVINKKFVVNESIDHQENPPLVRDVIPTGDDNTNNNAQVSNETMSKNK